MSNPEKQREERSSRFSLKDLEMTVDDLKCKWKKFVLAMNEYGIPVPLIHDPKTKAGSVSLTLVFISFNVWLISVIGKAAGALGGVDPNQSFNMVIACFGLYFGRKLQKGDKKSDSETKEE